MGQDGPGRARHYRGMTSIDRPGLGVLFILAGIFAISVNDMLIKLLSGGYPLHQIIFARSAIGLMFSLAFVQLEGGWRILRTSRPGMHLLRGLLVVGANLTFYAAVAVLPLGQATALFYVSPFFITLLSIPMLGEKVGRYRMAAVGVGLVGAIILQEPWSASLNASRFVLVLPILAAALYASMQVMTRALGASTPASALAVYIQSTFLVVSLIVFAVAGDGRFADSFESESLRFLLRPWTVPTGNDVWVFLGLGLCSGLIGYALSAAYRLASASVIAPFEYLGLPLAIFWGWAFWGDVPSAAMWIGSALIIGAGGFVFLREQRQARPMPGWRRRWGRR